MNASVSVLSLQPVPVAENWLGPFLAPTASACRFEKVPAIHLLPQTGPWGRHNGSVNPWNLGHNVELGLGLQLTHKERIQYVYLHECAHLVLENAVRKAGETMDAHGPCFLLVLMVLASRVDSAGLTKRPVFRMIDFYDFQDCPPFLQRLEEHQWRPLMLSFAFKHYKGLAASDLSAEAIGEEARRLWMEEGGPALYRIDKDLLQARNSLSAAQTRISELEHFSSPAALYTAVIVAGCASAALSVMATLAIL